MALQRDENTVSNPNPTVQLGNFRELMTQLSSAAETGTEPKVGRWVNGRLVAVLASPELGTSIELAMGLSLITAGGVTPSHHHRAEEIAIILSGSGRIYLGDAVIAVRAGDIVRTPSNVEHRTEADISTELQVLWMYAPAGSESRWLRNEPEERA
jgi:quercetin dioxygenase-like cupin family protein